MSLKRDIPWNFSEFKHKIHEKINKKSTSTYTEQNK